MRTNEVDVIDLPGELGSRGGCEAFELATDIASAGALDAVASAQLERHLATCASCRAYRDRSGELTAVVKTASASMQLSSPRWQEIEARLVRLTDPWRWVKIAMRNSVIISLYMAAAYAAAFVFWGPVPPFVFIMPLFPVAAIVFTSFREYRAVKHNMRVHDVMGAYRAQLKRAIKASRRGTWMMAASAVLYASPLLGPIGVVRLFVVVACLRASWMFMKTGRLNRRELVELS